MFWLILFTTILTLAYFYLKNAYQYWVKRNVSGPKPTLLVGNIGESVIIKKSVGQIFTDIYNDYQDLPFVGVYKMCTPLLLIRDIEFIRDVTIRHFSNFQDNDIEIDEKVDPMLGKNPFVLKGNHWRHVRGQITQCFTTAKLKSMFPLTRRVSMNFIDYIKKQIQNSPQTEFEVRELGALFTTDNVASCAFGLEGHSFDKKKSQIREIARKMLSSDDFWLNVRILLVFLIPSLQQIISLRLTPKDVEDEVYELVSNTLKHRKENNIVRNDFLHIMTQLKESDKNVDFTDEDIAAHAVGFIVDGIETSSLVISFTLFELTSNLDVQNRVRKEINDMSGQNGLTYEAIQEMKYLDAVVCETLRLHPPSLHFARKCTENYTFKSTDYKLANSTVTVEKGTSVILPVYGIHMDPQFYPNPKLFNPDRFLKENKNDLIPNAYFPMGQGPRACLGQHFGILQSKVAICSVIQNFEVSLHKKTQVPLKYEPIALLTTAIGGLWLNFKLIKTETKGWI